MNLQCLGVDRQEGEAHFGGAFFEPVRLPFAVGFFVGREAARHLGPAVAHRLVVEHRPLAGRRHGRKGRVGARLQPAVKSAQRQVAAAAHALRGQPENLPRRRLRPVPRPPAFLPD